MILSIAMSLGIDYISLSIDYEFKHTISLSIYYEFKIDFISLS
jgi:hypothetical protein